SIVFALYRGLVRELLGITAWILAGIAGLYSYSYMQSVLHKFIENEHIAGIVGALSVALIVLVIMTLINARITTKLRDSSLSGLDRILGFGFGIFRAWLLIAVVYIGASMVLSESQLTKADKENYTMPYIQTSALALERFMPETIRADIKGYEQGHLKKKDMPKIGKKITQKAVKKASAAVQKESDGYGQEVRESLDALIDQLD
ncbi:MAG: CvpA family protein, partial [Alphaproteobacteria bacterium]